MLDEPLAELPYAERTARMLAHHVGIWDVYRACVRPGAPDADIRAGEANGFSALFRETPRLRRVYFNGQTAGKFAPRLAALNAGLELGLLPSSSPAYTLPFTQKLERWREILLPLPK